MTGVALPWRIPTALPFYNELGAAQIKEQIKAPKIELSDEEMSNLLDAEFKILVIKIFTEMVEYGRKIEEEVKAMQSEIKKNIQGTNSERKEIRTQVNDLDQKEEINIQPKQNEEQEFKKLRRLLAGGA